MERNEKGQFVKGIISWSKSQKGIHLSPKTEFKKGYHYSPKTEFQKGQIPWNKTHILIHCDYCNKKFQQIQSKIDYYKNHYCSRKCFNQTQKGRIPWNKGKKNVYSEITRKRISQSQLGRDTWNKGIKMPKEFCDKMSQIQLGKTAWNKGLFGKGNSNWRGGISFEPYSSEFNKGLKEQIKKRDNYQCQICGRNNCQLNIHHIDYDKKNCNPDNLISLCNICHGRTISNRIVWTDFFHNIHQFIRL